MLPAAKLWGSVRQPCECLKWCRHSYAGAQRNARRERL